MMAWHAAALTLMLCGGGAHAFGFSGEKALIAVIKDGARTKIGCVVFIPVAAGTSAFKVQMDDAVMRDHFLSVREFKCLPPEQEISCFVPYPYAQPSTASSAQLAWLEHSLLFFYKEPRVFGAKPWNGIDFKFTATPTALVGLPQAVDLNRIGVPPDDLNVLPFGPMDRDPFTPGARWLTELRIESS